MSDDTIGTMIGEDAMSKQDIFFATARRSTWRAIREIITPAMCFRMG
ncbi:MAG: hypothetical protein ABGX16_22065 [Pirellulales bacterium]